MKAADLEGLSNRELMQLLRSGHAIDPAALDDSQYNGVALGMGRLVERLTWKRFQKVFHRDPASGHLRGWNVRIDQTQPGWQPLRKAGAPLCFGHYRVVPLAGRRMPAPLAEGLLIDYGQGGSSRMLSRMRDPIVALERGGVELLLGWTYLDLGLTQVSTPSFFSLERAGRLTEPLPAPA